MLQEFIENPLRFGMKLQCMTLTLSLHNDDIYSVHLLTDETILANVRGLFKYECK